MAGSRADVEAGKAHILLYMKSTVPKALNDLKKGIAGAANEIGKVGNLLIGLGTAITAPLVAAIAHFASAGSQLKNLSERTGISVAALVELKFAAEQTGTGIEAVENAIRNMQKTLVLASAGSKEAAKSIRDLHLDLKDLAGMPPDLQFQKIAERIAAIPDPAKRAATAMAIFGKTGTALLPMINSLADLRAEARALGLAPTERAVKLADELGNAWNRVKSVMMATVFEIGAALAPTVLPMLDAVTKIFLTIKKWAEQNSALVKSVFVLGIGLAAAGVSLKFIADTFVALSMIIGGTATILSLMLNPIVLIGLAIVGAVAAWIKFTDSGRAAAAALSQAFMPVVETIRTALAGIADALSAGDLELAGKIAAAGLKLIFADLGVAIIDVFGETFGSIASQILGGDFAGAWQTAVIGMAAVWESGVANMQSAFDSFAAMILETMESVVAAIESLWNGMMARIQATLVALKTIAIAGFAVLDRVMGHEGPSSEKDLLLGAIDAASNATATVGGVGQTGLAAARGGLGAAAEQRRRDALQIGVGSPAADEFSARTSDVSEAARKRREQLENELAGLRSDAARARALAQRPGSGAESAAVEGVTSAATSAAGTFSAAALLALGQGGGTPQERTAKAAEKTAERVDRLVKLNEATLEEAKAARLAVLV